MTHPYDWHRRDALLRAKSGTARQLLDRADASTHMAERARHQAALIAAEEALRVHQLSGPQENDQ